MKHTNPLLAALTLLVLLACCQKQLAARWPIPSAAQALADANPRLAQTPPRADAFTEECRWTRRLFC